MTLDVLSPPWIYIIMHGVREIEIMCIYTVSNDKHVPVGDQALSSLCTLGRFYRMVHSLGEKKESQMG